MIKQEHIYKITFTTWMEVEGENEQQALKHAEKMLREPDTYFHADIKHIW